MTAKLSLRTLRILRILRTLRSLKTIAIAAIVCCLASCVKEPLHNTDHPEQGKITTLTVTWGDHAEGVSTPAGYTANIGSYTADLQGETNVIGHLLPEGEHAIHIYNVADGITVSDTIATADYAAGLLGWFFTGTQGITIEKDKDHAFAVAGHQRVRELNLALELKGDARGRITGMDATLSGITGAISLAGEPSGAPATVALAFVKGSDGKYRASIRLLGINGDGQLFTLNLRFDDGSSETLAQEMHEPLKNFNGGVNPVYLEASLGLATVISDPVRILNVTAPAFEPAVEGYARPAAQPLAISNTGNKPATLSGVTVSPTDAFEIAGNGNTVPAGESIAAWTIQPRAGLAPGNYTATVTVAYDGTAETTATATVAFTVTAAPKAVLSVTAPTFPAAVAGYAQPAAKAITINNGGNREALVTSVSVSPDYFEISGSGNSVPAGKSIATWAIRPKAGLPAGSYPATITVAYEGGGQPAATATVNFVVDAAVPALTVSAPHFDSEEEGYATPAAKPVTIANTGNAAANITSVSVSNTYFIVGGSGSTVPVNGSTGSWTVRPRAWLSPGNYSAIITVSYDGQTATAAVYFTVTVAPARILHVAPTVFADADPGYARPAAKPLAITNSGNETATITGVSVSSPDFTIGGSGGTVEAGYSIGSWTVRPVAGLPSGTYTATVTVTYNGTAATTATATVSFTVNTPASPGSFTGTISGWTESGETITAN